MLKTKNNVDPPHVAKEESHVGAGESRIWAGLMTQIQTIVRLHHSALLKNDLRA